MIFALAVLLLRESVTRSLVLTMVLGLMGAVCVTGVGGVLGGTSLDPVGLLLMVLAVLCCAFYSVLSRGISDTVDPLFTVAVQQSAGLIWASAIVLVRSPFGALEELTTIPSLSLVAAMASGLLYYASAYWLYISALKTTPASVAGAYFNLIPVFGVGLAFLFLGERLSLLQWAGSAAIVLSALWLVHLTNSSEEVTHGSSVRMSHEQTGCPGCQENQGER
jgi:drug/metabolite transporter (DMT)-like permease